VELFFIESIADLMALCRIISVVTKCHFDTDANFFAFSFLLSKKGQKKSEKAKAGKTFRSREQ